MKNVLNRSLRLAVTAAFATSLLTGCPGDKHDSASEPAPSTTQAPAPTPAAVPAEATPDYRAKLLDQISGVWKPSVGKGLLTVYAANNDVQMSRGDSLLPVTLGNVDPENGTVNIKLMRNGKPEINTISVTSQEDATTINITSPDGTQQDFAFVRKISSDDMDRLIALRTAPSTPAPQVQADAPANRGVVDMWLSRIDMNLRSCPGSSCSALIVIPKNSKVSVDTSTVRNVTEAAGQQTPWVRVTYEGAYCKPEETDKDAGCTPYKGTDAPATGWMNYTRLLAAPLPQQ
ncbi:hypothetical protein [Caballeronia sp. TF1N1]|uniref:hypothetical protein n=1 Tax=Caballeronia sp. TF1N1 TaxID=2878153 RepID=UPI001FD20848|nr:hypothetical protein [Caballeronia sp. TF1N1]